MIHCLASWPKSKSTKWNKPSGQRSWKKPVWIPSFGCGTGNFRRDCTETLTTKLLLYIWQRATQQGFVMNNACTKMNGVQSWRRSNSPILNAFCIYAILRIDMLVFFDVMVDCHGTWYDRRQIFSPLRVCWTCQNSDDVICGLVHVESIEVIKELRFGCFYHLSDPIILRICLYLFDICWCFFWKSIQNPSQGSVPVLNSV